MEQDGRIHVAPNGCTFEKDGKQFFMMADTCWSAFTNMNVPEFERYLQQRKEQGFNSIQLNIPADGMIFMLYDPKRQERISAPITRDAGSFTVSYPGVNSDLLLIGLAKQ